MAVIGYTAGVFDLFHIGHLTLLQSAREQCDSLIVGLTTDELSHAYKKKTPVVPYQERAAILSSLEVVDEVIPQHTMDRVATWRQHRFDITFVGDDWKGSSAWADYERELAPLGVSIVYLPYTRHTSSTLLRATLQTIYGQAEGLA